MGAFFSRNLCFKYVEGKIVIWCINNFGSTLLLLESSLYKLFNCWNHIQISDRECVWQNSKVWSFVNLKDAPGVQRSPPGEHSIAPEAHKNYIICQTSQVCHEHTWIPICKWFEMLQNLLNLIFDPSSLDPNLFVHQNIWAFYPQLIEK